MQLFCVAWVEFPKLTRKICNSRIILCMAVFAAAEKSTLSRCLEWFMCAPLHLYTQHGRVWAQQQQLMHKGACNNGISQMRIYVLLHNTNCISPMPIKPLHNLQNCHFKYGFFLLYSVLYPPCTKSTTKVQRSMADCDRLTHAMCVSKYTMQLPASPRSMQSAYVIASVYIFGVYASHALSRGSGKHTKTHGSRSTIAQNFAFRNSVSVFCSSHRGKNRARIALLATATISSQCRWWQSSVDTVEYIGSMTAISMMKPHSDTVLHSIIVRSGPKITLNVSSVHFDGRKRRHCLLLFFFYFI